MNKKLTRLLILTLCAVLVCGALPVVTASAQIAENEYGEITFTTFEELQQLCGDIYPDTVTCTYAGEGTLEITGELTIPQTVAVAAERMMVAEGTELIVNGQLVADELTVNGILTSYGVISVLSDLYINGAVNNGGIIYMYAGVDGTLTNTKWLNHITEESGVIWICSFADSQELAKISEAAQGAPDGHYAYGIYATAEQVALDGWVSLPENCVLVVTQPLTFTGGKDCGLILEGNGQIGAALTMQCGLQIGQWGYLTVSAPVSVEGSLENKAVIDVFYDMGGRLSLSGAGSYIGHYEDLSSLIFVNSEASQLPQDAVTGLNLDRFQITEMDDEQYGHYWMLYDYEIPVSGSVLWGDVNGNGVVESYDATLILQYDVGMIDGSGLAMENMDVSGNGVIDAYDATLILQYDVGMITAFPAES